MSMILKTSQVSQLKTVFDTIKELLRDVNVYFIGHNEPEAGVLLSSMDSSNTALVYFKMSKEEIEKSGLYTCTTPCSAGINIAQFFKLLKTVKDHDTLTLRMKTENPQKLFMRSENSDKAKRVEFEISLMDIDEEDIKIGSETFESIITMDSFEFQQACRDINSVDTDLVTIASTGNKFIMSAKGDYSNVTVRLGEKRGTVFERSTQVCNQYPLKFLNCFTKATKLSSTVCIRMKNNFPIFIEYTIASLGLLRFVLSPLSIDNLEFPEELSKDEIPEIPHRATVTKRRKSATLRNPKPLKISKVLPELVIPVIAPRERNSIV